jgi:hypothetical protein
MYTIKNAYMTNTLPKDGLEAANSAQFKSAWYWRSEGTPEVAILIPRDKLSNFESPQASGQKAGGFEFVTASYPEAGKGGVLQFIGNAENVPKSEIVIIDLKQGTRKRW